MLPEWLQNKVSSSAEFSNRLDCAADQMNKAKSMLEQSGLVTSKNETDDMPF
jgi:DNA-binding transcriptional regulator YhcF (GntR family)